MTVLVVGGAGYIGSHMCLLLANAGYEVIVLDNLSTGVREFAQSYIFYEGELDDRELLKNIFQSHDVNTVMHFAAHIDVGESVQNPSKYYRNNVFATQTLLDAMLEFSVDQFIFSSTAAIFGDPEYIPIDEKHPRNPINPYGWSKLMVEQMLDDYDQAYGLKSICLRYFNAAGADPEGRVGECHDPETHLIPLVLQVAAGRKQSLSIFGDDYETDDGTCVRDYIHVNDICHAHLLALDFLKENNNSAQFNLGNGQGFSVQQVIKETEDVVGKKITTLKADQRIGDPAVLVADSTAAKNALGWMPAHNQLKDIISHAWAWEKKQSKL